MGAQYPHQLPPHDAHKTQFIDVDRANRDLVSGFIALFVIAFTWSVAVFAIGFWMGALT